MLMRSLGLKGGCERKLNVGVSSGRELALESGQELLVRVSCGTGTGKELPGLTEGIRLCLDGDVRAHFQGCTRQAIELDLIDSQLKKDAVKKPKGET